MSLRLGLTLFFAVVLAAGLVALSAVLYVLVDHNLALAEGRGGNSWYDTLTLSGQTLRLYTAPLLIDDDVIGFIQVARSLQDNEQTLAHVQRILLICDTLIVLTAAAV